MFSEFIDGLLNFHFLQNALITALVIGIVGGGCWLFYYSKRHVAYG